MDQKGLLTLTLQRSPGPRTAPPPRGLLVEARLGERTFHRRAPVSLYAVSERLELWLSAPGSANAILLTDLLPLRPLVGKQPFLLSLRNPGARERNADVVLLR